MSLSADEVEFAPELPRLRPLADLLDDVRRFLRRYIVLTDEQSDAATLWILHTYVFDCFDHTGYLAVTSPEKRSGKTRLLDVLELLVCRPWRAIEPSEAVLFRKIDADRPTLLLDEADAIFARGREHTEGLRALLNAGNSRGTMVPRCVGPTQALVSFSVFCCKAVAGIGALPDTVADRSIPIDMRRRVKSEPVARLRRRQVTPAADTLRAELEAWASGAAEGLAGALATVEQLADDGQPLASLDDRAFEQAWEPLLGIAAVAGETWLERAVAAALVLSGGKAADEPESIRTRLLADARAAFSRNGDKLPSRSFADLLAEDESSPWADWHGRLVTPRAIASLLAPFGIRPKTIRLDDGSTPKGYSRDQFQDAWARYLPEKTPQPPQRLNQAENDDYGNRHNPLSEAFVADVKQAENPHVASGVAVVADTASENGEQRLLPGDNGYPLQADAAYAAGHINDVELAEMLKLDAYVRRGVGAPA